MISNAPENYTCPICLGLQGIENDQTLIKQTDFVYKDDFVSAFINSFWVGMNEGHVVVVPNKHFETLYELPKEIGNRIFEVSQKIAIAMKKVYQTNGITIRQNNEPAGDQHAFHYHMHIFPRYTDDNFNQKAAEKKQLAPPEVRNKYAEKLKNVLSNSF